MTMENLSVADIAAVTKPNIGYTMGCNTGGGGFGFGNNGDWILALIVIAALFNGGFGGFGGGAGNGMQTGFDTQTILRGQEGIKNGLCDGFYAMNTNNLQAQNQTQRDLCQGFSAINAAIAQNGYNAQQCCCETQRAIDGVKYGNAQNTCDIINAIHAEGETTRGLINQNTTQALRDKLADKDRDILARDFQLSQLAQNSYLVNKLQPVPVPAFPVANPNQLFNNGYNPYNQFA